MPQTTVWHANPPSCHFCPEKITVIRNTPCRLVCVRRTDMRQCAFESPDLGQPFKYLGHHHITHRKFFRVTWSWKMPQKWSKTQKFPESQLALKNKIWSLVRFLKLSFTSTSRNVTIWCGLESPALGHPFKYFVHYHITHRKVFRATWSWKMPQKLTTTQKFRKSQLALKIKILSLARFVKLSFTYTVRNVTIWCALKKPWSRATF